MEEKEIHNELASIRRLMERSSKFISLSGLSGILAGVYGLIGAAVAYIAIYNDAPPYIDSDVSINNSHIAQGRSSIHRNFTFLDKELLLVALLVLAISLLTGFILTRNKAKRKGQQIWGSTSKALLFNMAVPLIAGGMLILVHIYHGHYGIVSPSCLIFYGLALVSASNFTFKDVRYLGLCEIILGLIAACLPGYGLLFWAIGFGVLHIIYGSMMYFKYDR
jgi:general stress protein CsbA